MEVLALTVDCADLRRSELMSTGVTITLFVTALLFAARRTMRNGAMTYPPQLDNGVSMEVATNKNGANLSLGEDRPEEILGGVFDSPRANKQ